jgi:hypothetical protein
VITGKKPAKYNINVNVRIINVDRAVNNVDNAVNNVDIDVNNVEKRNDNVEQFYTVDNCETTLLAVKQR